MTFLLLTYSIEFSITSPVESNDLKRSTYTFTSSTAKLLMSGSLKASIYCNQGSIGIPTSDRTRKPLSKYLMTRTLCSFMVSASYKAWDPGFSIEIDDKRLIGHPDDGR